MALTRSKTDVRIGIIGCGRAGASLHVPALRQVRGARVVALADLDPERSRSLASRCQGAAAYGEYQALLDDPQVDLAAVCVPVTLHAEVASRALGAGKHLFIEKPLALRPDEANRLVNEAARSDAAGLRSVVGFNLRSHRLLRQAKTVIRSGALGEIELLRTLWTADWSGGARPPWHAVRSEGGGALFEIGTHQADLWRWLLDSEVESIYALSRSTAFDDQTAAFEVRMAGGVVVSAAVSQRSVSHNIIEVFGSRGSLRLSCYHADSLEVSTAGSRMRGAWGRIGPLVSRAAQFPAALRAARGGGDFRLWYVHEWQRIVEALETGGPMPATVRDGRQALTVVLAALQSSRESRPVSLGTVDPAANATSG